jgi:hypothetical protein
MTAQLGAEPVKYQGPSLEGRAPSLNLQTLRLNLQTLRLNRQALRLNSGALNPDFHTFGFESRALRVERRARRLEHEAFCIEHGPRRPEKFCIFASVASRFVLIGSCGRIALLRSLVFEIWSIEFEGQRVVLRALSLALRGPRLGFLFLCRGRALLVCSCFAPCRGRLTFFVLPKKVSKERRARDGEPFLEFP